MQKKILEGFQLNLVGGWGRTFGGDPHKGVDPGILIYYWAAGCQFSFHS